MLSHVIEHIYDQKHFLEDVLSALAPGGVLVIVTPNAKSLIASISRSYWPMLKPVDHVNLLSPRAFEFLLTELDILSRPLNIVMSLPQRCSLR